MSMLRYSGGLHTFRGIADGKRSCVFDSGLIAVNQALVIALRLVQQ
jgi:hypothetical protein